MGVSATGEADLPRWREAALALSQRARLLAGGALGMAAGAGAALAAPWQLAVLVGWNVAAIVLVGPVWAFVPRLDGSATRAAAAREDLSRRTDDLIIIVASLISLIGVIVTLIEANRSSGILRALLIGTAVLTVVSSWIVVHTLFTLRYAHLYYDSPVGGIEFPDEDQPDYLDFAYLAFTIGMTFQVSDTNVSKRTIRRLITRHALLGYVFGTIIIGVTINVVASLVR